MRQLLVTSTLIIIFLLIQQPARAAEVLFAEDFGNDLEQWQFTRDDGRYWDINNGQLEVYIPNSFTITELVPADEVWGNIEDFDLNLDMTPIQGVDYNISFGFQDTSNWYELHFTDQKTILVKVDNGQATWVYETDDLILSRNTTYHLRIHFKQGKVTLVNDGQVIFSQQDPNFQNDYGKIGIKASSGSIFPNKVKFDNIVVRELTDLSQPSPQLTVPLIKQTNPAWASEEYDTASQWIEDYPETEPTIEAWGCNLVSLLSVMKYHGINQLPDGTELTPLSLNNWLVDNDGFINAPHTGLIDRKVVSKLTALITNQHQSPTLEFKYYDQDLINTAIREIDQQRPVILELDGHFVVATGYTDSNDLIINDPGYDHHLLSEVDAKLKSVRTFTPSFTDLSYLEVISNPELSVNILNQNGSEVANVSSYVESLSALGKSNSQQKRITEIAKPDAQSYIIEVENTDNTEENLLIRSFAENGDTEVFEKVNIPAQSSITWRVDINEDANDQIELKEVASLLEQSNSPSPTPSANPSSTQIDFVEPIDPQPISFSFHEIRLLVMTLQAEGNTIHPIIAQLLLKLIDLAERWYDSPAKAILIRIIRRAIEFLPESIITIQTKEELLLLIEVFDNPGVTVDS